MPDLWRATVHYNLDLGVDVPASMGNKRTQDFAGDAAGKTAARAWIVNVLGADWEVEEPELEVTVPKEKANSGLLEFIPEPTP